MYGSRFVLRKKTTPVPLVAARRKADHRRTGAIAADAGSAAAGQAEDEGGGVIFDAMRPVWRRIAQTDFSCRDSELPKNSTPVPLI